METAEQFLQNFWQEKAAAYLPANERLKIVHAKYFGNPLLKHAKDFMMRDHVQTIIENIQQFESTAVVIAREPIRAISIRSRYHLSALNQHWKITRIDRECLRCRGTGRLERTLCDKCDGEGWYDPRKDSV